MAKTLIDGIMSSLNDSIKSLLGEGLTESEVRKLVERILNDARR